MTSRRQFLITSAALGGGLALGFRIGPGMAADAPFAPNAFIRIGSDGQVVMIMPYVEMGQGTYTSIPMLIAEELEAVNMLKHGATYCSVATLVIVFGHQIECG